MAKDPALAELVRKEQDLGKQVNAQLGTLNNVLSLPSNERDEKGVQAINASIDTLRADRDKARQEINQRFPSYADLIDPKPPTVEQIKATLTPGEAMLSFYFGREAASSGRCRRTARSRSPRSRRPAGDLESKVRKLREALEPQAAMISDIPAFDRHARATSSTRCCCKPVEAGWKSAKQPDRRHQRRARAVAAVAVADRARGDQQRRRTAVRQATASVPWLARTHAVTMVPSAAALRTLRQLPPGQAGARAN